MNKEKNEKGTSPVYTSFEDIREKVWGLPPLRKKNKDPEALKEQQEYFCGKKFNRCRACGQPMTYMGGNIMACTNENCKGIKIERKDEEGNTKVSYVTSYRLLNDFDAMKANNMFS